MALMTTMVLSLAVQAKATLYLAYLVKCMIMEANHVLNVSVGIAWQMDSVFFQCLALVVSTIALVFVTMRIQTVIPSMLILVTVLVA
jgi:hypothetical protein